MLRLLSLSLLALPTLIGICHGLPQQLVDGTEGSDGGTSGIDLDTASTFTKPSANASTCFYGQIVNDLEVGPECGAVWTSFAPGYDPTGSPNVTLCYQSMALLCAYMTNLTASNSIPYGYQTGTGKKNGANADCYAIAANGVNATAPLSYKDCYAGLEANAACSDPNSANYDNQCVGGNTNIIFNSGGQGTPVDPTKPRYGVGVRNAFGSVVGAPADNPQPFNGQITSPTSQAGAALYLKPGAVAPGSFIAHIGP